MRVYGYHDGRDDGDRFGDSDDDCYEDEDSQQHTRFLGSAETQKDNGISLGKKQIEMALCLYWVCTFFDQ